MIDIHAIGDTWIQPGEIKTVKVRIPKKHRLLICTADDVLCIAKGVAVAHGKGEMPIRFKNTTDTPIKVENDCIVAEGVEF